MNQEEEILQLKQQIARYESIKSYQDDEIDLREMWSVIWAGKWKITVITFVFAVTSVFYALSLPNIYKSEALLMPNSQDSQQGGLGALAGQFGGLASLAGVSFGGGGTDKTGYALKVLQSRKFLFDFFEKNELKAPLMAIVGWDRENQKSIYNEDIYNIEMKQWVKGDGLYEVYEPTLLKTYEHFVDENLSITQDKNSGMIIISISHYSPILAKKLVEKLTMALNETIKQQDMSEAKKSIEYLEKELETNNVVEARSIFYKLIEQQQQTIMLTKVRNDYVLKTVDPAILAEEKEKPKRGLIVVLAIILGIIFSILIILLRYFNNK